MAVIIIAEAGVNHDGDLGKALALVDVAADCGADIVKFQTFRAEALVTATAPKAAYQAAATGGQEGQLAMLRRLELSKDQHYRLIEHCQKRKIGFLSTPFDSQSLAFLMDDLHLDRVKIPSGEITNGPFLLDIAATGRPVILSTGMATLADIEQALGVLAFGFTVPGQVPSRAGFAQAFASDAGQAALRDKVSLLHCTTEYPAPPAEINLAAMTTLAHAFGLPVGLSDHSAGTAIAAAAVALGAAIIEKHITLDCSAPGPDHAASLDPAGLSRLVADIRTVEMALGDGIKRPSRSERGNMTVARKSLVAVAPIAAGEPLSATNMAVLRPGDGVSPMEWWDRLGQPASRSFAIGEAIAP